MKVWNVSGAILWLVVTTIGSVSLSAQEPVEEKPSPAPGAEETQVDPRAPQEPAITAEEAAERIRGRWFSNFGYMELEVEGTTVSGSYSCCKGELRGTMKGPSHIEFFWKDPIYGYGWGNFYLPEPGGRLVGGWGKEDDFGSAGPWNAVRLDSEAENKTEGQEWKIATKHPIYGELDGIAHLQEGEDGKIVGSLTGRYTLDARGNDYLHEVRLGLEGERSKESLTLHWTEPIDQTTGTIELTPIQGEGGAWAGTWQPDESSGSMTLRLRPNQPKEIEDQTTAAKE